MTSPFGPAIVAERRGRYRVATGLMLNVVEWGDPRGDAVLILHGGAHDARRWEVVGRLLAARFRCIAPDARGHGESEWSEAGDYSCASQVADLTSLLDVLGISRCHIVGHSMGGLNALELAGASPGRVHGLVLIDVGTETSQDGMRRVRRSRGKASQQGKQGNERKEENDDGEGTGAGSDVSAPGAPFDVRLVDHVPTYCGDAAHRRSRLLASGSRLLMLRGEHSKICTQASAEATAALVGAAVFAVPDSGHNVAEANPAGAARAIGDFLDSLGPLSG